MGFSVITWRELDRLLESNKKIAVIDLRKPEYLYRIVQDALAQGREMKEHTAKIIRKSGLEDTEERIRQVILWNRKEKREPLPEEIREKIFGFTME